MSGKVTLEWHEATSSNILADNLADWVAERLGAALSERGTAFLAVSGGTTPKLFFQALSKRDLDWSKVVVTLIDERFVAHTSPRSNQGLAQANLLQNEASAARFLPLYNGANDPDEGARLAEEALSDAPWPLDVAVLGMGTDGHTASLFPDAPNLDELLDPNGPRKVDAVHAASAGEPRLTLTLPAIVSAHSLVLHIEGDAKRQALQRALAERDGRRKPIASVVDQARQLEVFWTAG